jgi:hypothetical protein
MALGLREHTLLSNFLLLDTLYKAVDFNAPSWISHYNPKPKHPTDLA